VLPDRLISLARRNPMKMAPVHPNAPITETPFTIGGTLKLNINDEPTNSAADKIPINRRLATESIFRCSKLTSNLPRLIWDNISPVEHEEIILHLSKNDSQGAEEAMLNHLNASLDGMDFEKALPDDYITI
jgi:hypothetical protein